jgi:hypothetical protein
METVLIQYMFDAPLLKDLTNALLAFSVFSCPTPLAICVRVNPSSSQLQGRQTGVGSLGALLKREGPSNWANRLQPVSTDAVSSLPLARCMRKRLDAASHRQ